MTAFFDIPPEIVCPAVTGMIGVLLGTLLGSRLAISRDKRKEWNDITFALRGRLTRHREGLPLITPCPDPLLVDDLRMLMPYWTRKRFNRSYGTFLKCASETTSDERGRSDYKDEKAVVKAIDDVICFLKRR